MLSLSQLVLFLTLVCHKFTFFHVLSLFQGADFFAAKINIEVQRATEGAIAAIERAGGVITTSFYDPISLGNELMISLLSLKHNYIHLLYLR